MAVPCSKKPAEQIPGEKIITINWYYELMMTPFWKPGHVPVLLNLLQPDRLKV
jgi:hypothetical protein